MATFILRQYNSRENLWEKGFDHHLEALVSFIYTPKTPQNTPVYISVPHSSGWGNFEGNFSYVLNSPYPESYHHCFYIDKRGERIEIVYSEERY